MVFTYLAYVSRLPGATSYLIRPAVAAGAKLKFPSWIISINKYDDWSGYIIIFHLT